MYQLLKSLAYKIVSKRQLFRYEVAFRNIYSVFYSGSKHECTICKRKLRTFLTLPNNDRLCPKCGSLSRDRRLWQLLDTEFLAPGQKVLDFSPSRPLSRQMRKQATIDYMASDLSGNFIADHQFDITKIGLNTASLDLIICYHILEHIDDDRKAMAELYRTLRVGGKAIVQTPFKEGGIYENSLITDPKEREVHFGQDDHVRIYSVNGLKGRLEGAGFLVDIRHFNGDDYNGFANRETVFVLTKT
ncbi:MAG: class I SAM-dependent methyltransferase [Flavobacterium sp.]|nr:MAG: class I SAM-dependent methyltransferase [Flavobacterium sp.]